MTNIHWCITLVLFIIPFFWLPPGTMDLGGDSSRLYFYDPASYLRHVGLYGVVPVGQGSAEPYYYYIPFVGLLWLLKFVVGSPWALITLFNSLKLSVGFLFVYFTIRRIEKDANLKTSQANSQLAAVAGGVAYIAANVSPYLSVMWNRALTSHNQIFLNPMIFYLLLHFFLTKRPTYLWISIVISFVFAANFALTSAPAFFSFYPVALLFLILYTHFIVRTKIPWVTLLGGLLAFGGVQAFHLIPQVMSVFDPGSFSNTKLFSRAEMLAGGLGYFNATYGLGKVSLGVLLPSVIVPALVLVAFFFGARLRSMYLVVSFVIVTLFLVTANITGVGLSIYRKLFLIPGFSMFRVFYERWAYVLVFYYSLLFGLSSLSLVVEKKRANVFVIAALILMGLSTLPIIQGKLVNVTHWGTPEASVVWQMDPKYEETLDRIRALPEEGKMLTLPLTDAFHQVLYGTNEAAYVGTATIGQLTGMYDFPGYQLLYPYPEDIRQFSKDKNYKALTQIFSLLGIRYIFHNSDPRIYDFPFDEFPNGYMKTAMPATQAQYVEYISHLPVHKIYENGPYALYEFDGTVTRPLVYAADSIVEGTPAAKISSSYRSMYVGRDFCGSQEGSTLCVQEVKLPSVLLTTRKVSPSQYKIVVQEQGIDRSPWILVFLNTFHRGWKLTTSDGTVISDDRHLPVNGYANAWIMERSNLPTGSEYVLTLTLTSERYFWIGSVVSIITLAFVFVLLGRSWRHPV
ncbi:MAG TPA: hypothetical protein VJB96_02980 [Patescibacteria group bacterium]|nr:hypothetical protein [Patescibacteria group bacterium]